MWVQGSVRSVAEFPAKGRSGHHDFAEMLSEMLGGMNASHEGCYDNMQPNRGQPAALGVLVDDAVKELMKK
jgi:hypothetical protein